MSMPIPVAQRQGDCLTIVCPAGDCLLMLPVRAPGEPHRPNGAEWEFDGNVDAPTLSPSLLTQCKAGRCHSYLRGGNVEFLHDSTHSCAGQTVPLRPLPDWAIDEDAS